jgi:hypothetical protein
LTNINTSSAISISTNTTNQSQYIPYAISFGSTTGLGATNNFVLNPSTGNVGIGTTNPTSKLHVVGDVRVTGVVTASSFSGNASSATYATSAGIATYATTAGVATALQTSRTFEITGDIIASPISFNGTGNVSLAATIQPNSVGLGTDTFGDYVETISGTANQITVTNGTGERSNPALSIPSQFTVPQDITVTRDLQVNRNLNVNGNITIGGTSATLFTTEFKVFDPDIVLGFRTDSNGNDSSTDNTANHGGIAIASTEGTPLVQLYNPGIGETNPATYKKIMWFEAGAFAGLNTDAWLINYAVGIGSTQFPSGTRLAAGSVQFTEQDLAVVRNINASGIITANGGFVGSLTGTASHATSAGIATYATSSGVSTSVIGGIGSITQLQVTGISTFTNGPVFIGSGTSTGTSGQVLQVAGINSSVYIGGNLGIGTTNPTSKLHIIGNTLISGIATITSDLIVNGGTLDVDTTNNRVGIGTLTQSHTLDVNGDARIQGSGKMRFGGNSSTTNFYIQYNSSTNSLDFVAG